MKTIVLICLIGSSYSLAKAQSIIGEWQLVKESTCLDDQVTGEDGTEAELMTAMKSMSSPTPQIVKFKEKMVGEESTRMLTRKKPDNKTRFLYKFDGERLWILDKRSQTITEAFNVEKISADSLIISSANRPCETKFFVRLK